MIIRAVANADLSAVRSLVFSVLGEFGFTPDHANTDADLEDIEAHYLERGGSFDVLVTDEGTIVGTVGLAPLRSGVCELRKMYLRRDLRGQGHGRRMLEHAVGKARQLGFHRIELFTASRLVDAIAMYRRFGFQEVCTPITCDRCDHVFGLNIDRSVPSNL